MHHDLDIHPIPEKVLYINDLTIADTAPYYETTKQYEKALTGETQAKGGILPDDNVRIYVPLDLNADQILHRLREIYRVMESPDDMNESDFWVETNKIVAQLEIYDQVWVARNLKDAVRINDNIHSPKGIQLAKEIIAILMEDEGFAAEAEEREDIRLFLEKGTALTSEVLQCVTEQAGHRRIPVGERRSYLN